MGRGVILLLLLFAVEVVVTPVAPWWAGPAYLATFERIVITLITIGVPTLVTAGVQIYYGRNARKDRVAKRAESHLEHERGLAAAREREIALAAKVDATALHMADKVEATKAETLAAISENTAITTEAKAGALQAYQEANTVNLKIAETNERITEAIKAGQGKQPESL